MTVGDNDIPMILIIYTRCVAGNLVKLLDRIGDILPVFLLGKILPAIGPLVCRLQLARLQLQAFTWSVPPPAHIAMVCLKC